MSEHPPFEPTDGSLPTEPPYVLPDPEPIAPAAVGPTGAVAKPGGSRSGVASWIGAGAVAVALVIGGVVVLGRSSAEPATTSANAATSSSGSSSSGSGSDSSSSGASSSADGTGSGTQRRPGGGATSGSITAIDGTTLTVAATDQSGAETTVTVTTDDTTTYAETVAGTLDDLVVGDNVVVMGETDDATAAVTAASIADSGDVPATTGGFGGVMPGSGMPGGAPPEGMTPSDGATMPEGVTPPEGMTPPDGATMPDGAAPPQGGGGFGGARTTGTIATIDGSTITITTTEGTTVTVTTTAETQVSITETLTFDDLRTGDAVRVRGQAESTDETVVAAVSVQRGDLAAGPGMGGPGGSGRPGGAAGSSSSTPTTTADGE